MSIQVTPIPRLTTLVAPAFSLGTANAAGDAITGVASNSTLLAFDATLPDAITFGQSGAAGSATVTSRRDHAHAMVGTPISDIRCAAYADASQTLSDNTETAIALNQESFDTDSMHDTTTNNSRITINTAGTYVVTSNITYAANGTGFRKVILKVNGSTEINQCIFAPYTGSDNLFMASTVYTFAEDDYIETLGYQNSGGNLVTNAHGNYGTSMRAVKVVG